MEDDVRGMRVNVNIELCLWRHIAVFQDRPAHDDQLLHSRCKARFLADRHGNIRQRPDGEDADLVGLCQDAFDQVIDGMSGHRRGFWLGQLRIANAAFPMHGRRRRAAAGQEAAWLPLCHRNMAGAPQLQHRKSIRCGFFKRHIALCGGQRFQLDLRRSQRQQECQRIVHARVGVNNDSFCHR